jgi:hypothetical protein
MYTGRKGKSKAQSENIWLKLYYQILVQAVTVPAVIFHRNADSPSLYDSAMLLGSLKTTTVRVSWNRGLLPQHMETNDPSFRGVGNVEIAGSDHFGLFSIRTCAVAVHFSIDPGAALAWSCIAALTNTGHSQPLIQNGPVFRDRNHHHNYSYAGRWFSSRFHALGWRGSDMIGL